MTTRLPLPASGGSYLRHPDGRLEEISPDTAPAVAIVDEAPPSSRSKVSASTTTKPASPKPSAKES